MTRYWIAMVGMVVAGCGQVADTDAVPHHYAREVGGPCGVEIWCGDPRFRASFYGGVQRAADAALEYGEDAVVEIDPNPIGLEWRTKEPLNDAKRTNPDQHVVILGARDRAKVRLADDFQGEMIIDWSRGHDNELYSTSWDANCYADVPCDRLGPIRTCPKWLIGTSKS